MELWGELNYGSPSPPTYNREIGKGKVRGKTWLGIPPSKLRNHSYLNEMEEESQGDAVTGGG